MGSMRLFFALLAVSALAWSQDALKPSRPPSAGCAWKPWRDEQLGILMLVQECPGGNAPKFVSANSTVRIVVPGKNPAQSPIALEVYEKPERQKVRETIDGRFKAKLSSRQKAGCEVADITEKLSLAPGAEAWQIVPYGPYKAEAARQREAEPSAEVCGAYGEIDTLQYFEYHPSESKSRYLYVRLGPDARLFDERSIRILIE